MRGGGVTVQSVLLIHKIGGATISAPPPLPDWSPSWNRLHSSILQNVFSAKKTSHT